MLTMELPSHVGDGADLAVARCRCRVMLVTALLSHPGDGATEETLAVT
jgi:hypothetical protein